MNTISLWLKKWYLQFTILLLLLAGIKFGGFYGFYINGDGKGYYAYLPSVFIYKDYNFSFINKMDEKYYPEGARSDFRTNYNGIPINKYYIGLSVLWLPFFLTAHFLSHLFGFPTDGYSPIYQYAILFAALFYLWIGLMYLRRLLRIHNLTNRSVIMASIIIVFSTPLIFYTILNPDWSHLYSFTLVTAFFYHVKKYTVSEAPQNIILFMVFLGLIAIVRPINGIVICSIPFIAGSWEKTIRLFSSLFGHIRHLIVGTLLFASILLIQLLFYKLETGSWLIYSYTYEGFQFLKPHFFEVLAGYRKGILIYTPVLLLSFIGLYRLFRQNTFMAVSLLLFLIFVIYILSSWDTWGYGMCFGFRPITEYLPFFAIILGIALQIRMSGILKILCYFFIVFTIVYNTVLLHQYKHYILHWDSMDKESYWKIFMRTSSEYHGILWKNDYPVMQKRPSLPSDTIFFNDFERLKISSINGYNDTKAFPISKEYGNILKDSTSLFLNQADSVCFYISFYIKPITIIKKNTLKIKFTMRDSMSVIPLKIEKPDILPFRKNTWYCMSYLLSYKSLHNGKFTLKTELTNKTNQKFLLDNFTIELFDLHK